MTEITVVRSSDGKIRGLEAKGHSGDAVDGENIVCASITSIFEYLSIFVEKLPEEGVIFRQEVNQTSWRIEFHEEQLNSKNQYLTNQLLKNSIDFFRKINQKHPERCKLSDPGAET